MADFCASCSIELFDENLGDLANLTTQEDAAAGRYAIALCEGCGLIQVDPDGVRVYRVTSPPRPPRVLNKKTDRIPPDAIYCGRPSPWGNPFVIGRDGTRNDVIAKYEQRIMQQPHLLARLDQLKGRDLICWCRPLACHCSVLIRLANPSPARRCEAVTATA